MRERERTCSLHHHTSTQVLSHADVLPRLHSMRCPSFPFNDASATHHHPTLFLPPFTCEIPVDFSLSKVELSTEKISLQRYTMKKSKRSFKNIVCLPPTFSQHHLPNIAKNKCCFSITLNKHTLHRSFPTHTPQSK